MEMFDSKTLPLSSDPKLESLQKEYLKTQSFSKSLYGRDQLAIIKQIGDYECKSNHCYRCIDEKTLKLYMEKGYIFDEKRTDYIEGVNNQGIDWYLGGAAPSLYGNIIIECPAYKDYFVLTIDNGCAMTIDPEVRHIKSSPNNNPIPINLITNIFNYKEILENEKSKKL